MPEIEKPKDSWKVVIIESERGFGQKVDDVKYFDDEEDAKKFVRAFNAQNAAGQAPDWYMYAESPQKVR